MCTIIIVVLVRFIQPPCISNFVYFSPCMLAQDTSAARVWGVPWKVWTTKRPRQFGSRAIWNLLAERCLKSYCSVVSLFCFDTLRNFSASLPRNVDVVAQRRTTSLGVLHRRGRCCSMRTISSTISGVPWSFNGSGRVVSWNTVAGRRHADRTVHRVTWRRTPTKSDFADPRRKHVIRC